MTEKEELWKRIQAKIKDSRKCDKSYMLLEGKEITPHLNIYRYCINCDKVEVVLSIFAIEEMESIRDMFAEVLKKMLFSPLQCLECEQITMPLAYSWHSTGWMLTGTPEKEEDFQRYWRVMGTIKRHPDREEIYVTTTATMVKEKQITIITNIHRKKDKIVSFEEDEEIEGGGGIFQIDLPQYSEKFYNKLKKEMKK